MKIPMLPSFGDLGFGVIPNRPIEGNTQIKNNIAGHGRNPQLPTKLKDWDSANLWSDTDTWQGSAI